MPGLIAAKDLREQRATLANEAKALVDAAPKEGMSDESRAQFDRIMEQVDSLKADIDRIEKHEALQSELSRSTGTIAATRQDETRGKPADQHQAEVDAAFDTYLRYGTQGLSVEQRAVMNTRFQRDGVETRAPQTVTTTAGGYLIPQGFSGKLEESMKLYGGVENVADIFETETGNTLPWPTVDDTSNTGRLLAINTAATETAVAYGQTLFAAYKFSSDMVTVPVELMQDSAFDVSAHLSSVLGTRLGRVHNTYQTTGTGSSQPGGISVGAGAGVTAAGTADVTADELIDLVHAVDPAYRHPSLGAGFMFNDGTLKKLRKLKDGEGRYLWQAGLNTGSPDSLLGYPIQINQDMPAMTTGLKPILFGALKKFKIRKVKGITLLRLDERYAELHQVAFLAFTRFDSKVLDAGTDPIKVILMA